MLLFLCGIAVLVAGYFTYGKLVEKAFMKAFPDHYVDGVLVTSEEEREAALRVAAEKQKELESED